MRHLLHRPVSCQPDIAASDNILSWDPRVKSHIPTFVGRGSQGDLKNRQQCVSLRMRYNVLGPVFEGEDQQLWISGVGPASCQMWDVRPDPMFDPMFLNCVSFLYSIALFQQDWLVPTHPHCLHDPLFLMSYRNFL